ncbi:E3 ubiquitin-protein ligase rififylin [Colossoma macropomum]|uniref:E3 ubiquitin-protein ligase rififylin n=1 Tax=Colossoma macropomum TaxID=42526 RepID=UPI0018648D6D|nr:E3 ubiquitin-protein ligase rififylin [Colossoma macropomum]
MSERCCFSLSQQRLRQPELIGRSSHPRRGVRASCCSWLCVDTTATVEENSSSWRQAYTNSGYSPPPTSPEHLCKACGGQFDTARRNVCVDCRKQFCGRCWVQPELRLCHTCQRFHGTHFERSELMRLKVKELRDYLHLHEIPTQTCREKEELVELVLGQHTPSSSSSSSSSSNNSVSHPAALDPPQPPTPPSQSAEEPEEFTEEEEGEDEDEEDDDDESTDSEETLVHSHRASLSDLSSVQDIEGLSVRQLKEILARNFVNYKGCCEKWELMERVTRLFNDQKDLHNLVSNTKKETGTAEPAEPSGQEENLCKICMDSPIDCVLLECGHMVTCSKCGKRMSECPICRQYVVRAVHVFRS